MKLLIVSFLLCLSCTQSVEPEKVMFRKGINLLPDTFDKRAKEIARRQPPAAPVAIMEPQGGIWTGNNNFGIEQPFAPDANNRQTILKMPEWGFPQVWTITLGMKGFPQGFFNGFMVRAIIEAGVGGAIQTTTMDWRVGTQISLPMNALNVIAEYTNLDIITEGQGLSLSVLVGRGNRPGCHSGPTNTLIAVGDGSGILAPGTLVESVVLGLGDTTGLMRLPQFASKVYAVPAGPVFAGFYSDDTFLQLVTGGGAGAYVVQSQRGSDLRLRQNAVEISGSAQFARFVNNGADPVTVTCYCELSL